MTNRAPSSIWPLRRDCSSVYVCTTDEDRIQIAYPTGGGYVMAYSLSRKDARLLAKRINQCLDATVKP